MSNGTMTTPPPRPVSAPRRPATTEPSHTAAVNARMLIREQRLDETWHPGLPGLLLVGCRVAERERLERRVGEAKSRRFGRRAIRVPSIDGHSLDHPQRRRTVRAGA